MSGPHDRSGAKGSRKEAQLAAILGRAGWAVHGPLPRVRFVRSDIFGLFDLEAVRADSPHLYVQATDGRDAYRKRDAIDASPEFSRLARAANYAVLVAAWSRRRRSGFAWKVEKAYGGGEWRALGFVTLAGEVLDTNGGTLTRLLIPRKEAKGVE